MPENVLFSWSGGKDSAMALYELQRQGAYEIAALLTTVTEGYDRISMHGVPRVLLEQQAASLGLALEKIYITKNASNKEYEEKMRDMLVRYKDKSVTSVVFGDIFLEDLKKYREEKLSELGMNGIFPIWKRDTKELARAFMSSGFRAVITCVDTHVVDKKFAGRIFDEHFLSDIPSSVDSCGENGEFHSFVYDGPLFKEKVKFEKGEIVLRDNRFCYCDLVPVESGKTYEED